MWTILALTVGWMPAQANSPFQIGLQLSGVPAVQIQPTGQESIWLPQCRGVLWERFNPKADHFELLSLKPCEMSGLPHLITAEGHTVSAPSGVTSGDRVRVTVVVGVDCSPDRPIEIAHCQRFEQLVDRGTVP